MNTRMRISSPPVLPARDEATAAVDAKVLLQLQRDIVEHIGLTQLHYLALIIGEDLKSTTTMGGNH